MGRIDFYFYYEGSNLSSSVKNARSRIKIFYELCKSSGLHPNILFNTFRSPVISYNTPEWKGITYTLIIGTWITKQSYCVFRFSTLILDSWMSDIFMDSFMCTKTTVSTKKKDIFTACIQTNCRSLLILLLCLMHTEILNKMFSYHKAEPGVDVWTGTRPAL